MDINTIIKSTEYLEFINSVDFLYWELLYSKNNGFISLTSKDAINQAKNVLISFDSETDKIAKKVNFEDKNEIIQNKRQDLISKINEHCYDQSLIWANEVYNDAIKNILLSVSIDKKNVNECYQKGLSAINWVCSVKKSNEKIWSKIFCPTNLKIYNIIIFFMAIIIFELGYCNHTFTENLVQGKITTFYFSICRGVIYILAFVAVMLFNLKVNFEGIQKYF